MFSHMRTIRLFAYQAPILALIVSNVGRRGYQSFRITCLDERLDSLHLTLL